MTSENGYPQQGGYEKFLEKPILKSIIIDDIGVEIIAMHCGIVWGEKQRVVPQNFPSILWEYSLFPPYNTIMHCDNFNSDM